MQKNLKLLILAKAIDGGTGTFILNFLKINRVLGDTFQIKIFVLEKPNFRKINEKGFIFLHKKKFYPLRYSVINSFKYFIFDIFCFKKLVREEKPDIIISVNYYSNILVSLANKIFSLRKKIILTHHNNLSILLKQRCSLIIKFLLKLILPFLFNEYNNVTVSKSLGEELSNKFKIKNIKAIYNGIEITKHKQRQINKKNNLISIGRLDKEKDYLTLLKAFSQLRKKINNIFLTLIGDGPDLKVITDNIKKLNLGGRIKIKKWKNAVTKYLLNSHIFVISSNYEGFPYVILEAMACGLPIISTDTPFGPREILDNGKYGILVPMKDPQAMAKAMYELLTNKKKYQYYSQKSLERVKYFSLEKMLKAYKKLILEVLNK